MTAKSVNKLDMECCEGVTCGNTQELSRFRSTDHIHEDRCARYTVIFHRISIYNVHNGWSVNFTNHGSPNQSPVSSPYLNMSNIVIFKGMERLNSLQ